MIMIVLSNEDLKKAKRPSPETKSDSFITFEISGKIYSIEESREGYFIKISKKDCGEIVYMSQYKKDRYKTVRLLNDLLESTTKEA